MARPFSFLGKSIMIKNPTAPISMIPPPIVRTDVGTSLPNYSANFLVRKQTVLACCPSRDGALRAQRPFTRLSCRTHIVVHRLTMQPPVQRALSISTQARNALHCTQRSLPRGCSSPSRCLFSLFFTSRLALSGTEPHTSQLPYTRSVS